jgi:pimeloyl-ACP methyl ester carboxylesterase
MLSVCYRPKQTDTQPEEASSKMGNENRYWRDPALGEAIDVDTRGGKLRAFSAGSGEPIVFVHGALVNANLWRKVVPLLAPDFRCITLDMPLGSHELAMPHADLSPTGLADLIADAITGLGVERPTLVGNDSGGALSQIAVARHPDLVGRLVLTSCDAYDEFPPRFFSVLLWPTRFPALSRALFAPLRIRALRETPLAFGWLMHTKLDERAGDSYVLPPLTSPEAGADFSRFMRTANGSHTMAAIEKLRSFDRPALIAWSRDDKFFHAGERLAADIPGARLEWIENARTFSMEDQPERLAELVAGFVREPTPVEA